MVSDFTFPRKIPLFGVQNSKDKRNFQTKEIVLQYSLFASDLILCSVARVA